MVLDAITICSAFLFAYYLWFSWMSGPPENPMQQKPDLLRFAGAVAVMGLAWVFQIWREKGYENKAMGTETVMRKMQTVMVSGLYALGPVVLMSVIFSPRCFSWQACGTAMFLALSTMYLSRKLFKSVDQDFAEQEMVAHRILIAGLNPQGLEFANLLSQTASLCRVVGFVDLNARGVCPPQYKGYPVLGRLEDVRRIYEDLCFDKLVIPDPKHHLGDDFIDVLNFCESREIALYSLPNRFHVAVEQREISSFSGIPMIQLRDAGDRVIYPLIKRVADIVLASAALVFGLPIWLALALGIKLYDRGPVFFNQTRAGLHGQPFKMYKFRSMVNDAEKKLADLVDLDNLDEPVFKIRNDPRVTPLGRFMRRTGLDEIPQLLNVLKGDMSLVGPRPEEMSVVERYNGWQRRRLKAVPGITGHQQIHNRGEASLARRIEYDLIYIKHQSLVLDLIILMKTVMVVLTGKGVTH